jgi:hypothetical protein
VNFCFASNLDEMIRSPIRAWICGHSHQQQQTNFNSLGSPILAINAFGYNLNEQYGYGPERVISFDCSPQPAPELV